MTEAAESVLPELSQRPRELASRDQRFTAALVDGALCLICVIVGLRIARPFLAARGSLLFRAEQELVLLVASAPLLLYQWRSIARTGQSIGKRWLKIEIVCVAGPPSPGWVHGVVLREWVLHGLWIGLYIVGGANQLSNLLGLAVYVPIFFKDRRCLHDYIAGTQVVRKLRDDGDRS